jgi:hypothetical protein
MTSLPTPSLLRSALAATICIGLSLAAGTSHAAEETTPLTVDAAFNPAAAAAKGFTVSDAQAVKAVKRVAVPVFAVEFIIADNVSSQSSGFGGGGGRTTSSLYYKLLGVGEPEFQAITDALYAQFLQELQTSGLEVVDVARVRATTSYAKLVAGTEPAPIKTSGSMMMSPPGLGIYGFAKTGGGNSAKTKSLFGALADAGASFSAVGSIGDTVALSKELDASLLQVRMRVSFVKLADEAKGLLSRLGGVSAVSGKHFPSVDNVMVSVQSGVYGSVMTLKHSLTLDSAAFAQVREKPATAADKAGTVAVALLQLAVGSKDSISSTELEVLADPVKYREVVGAGLASAGSMVVARLKAER